MNKLWGTIFTLVLIAMAFDIAPLQPSALIIESESFAEIVAPMQVIHVTSSATVPSLLSDKPSAERTHALAGASGDAYVELPLGSGQGWRGKGNGRVTYRIDVPSGGRYRIWGRMFWQDGCTNAVFLSINQSSRTVFGNDAVFGQWHWVKGQTVNLHKGVNYLTFSNHSDGIALDKLEITNDLSYCPEGLGGEITRFYDGFAGCDADNTGSWQFMSGKWRVVEPGRDESSVNACLAQWDPSGGAALAGFPIWTDYDAQVSIRFSGPASAGLLFFSTATDQTLALSMNASETGCILTIEKRTSDTQAPLAMVTIAGFAFDRWYQLGYRVDGQTIQGFLDDTLVCQAQCVIQPRGQLGLFTANGGGVYFDNIQADFKH